MCASLGSLFMLFPPLVLLCLFSHTSSQEHLPHLCALSPFPDTSPLSSFLIHAFRKSHGCPYFFTSHRLLPLPLTNTNRIISGLRAFPASSPLIPIATPMKGVPLLSQSTEEKTEAQVDGGLTSPTKAAAGPSFEPSAMPWPMPPMSPCKSWWPLHSPQPLCLRAAAGTASLSPTLALGKPLPPTLSFFFTEWAPPDFIPGTSLFSC